MLTKDVPRLGLVASLMKCAYRSGIPRVHSNLLPALWTPQP